MVLMGTLTSTQVSIFSYIISYLNKEGRPPTLDEIAIHFQYKSINTVRSHLRLIEKKGYIKIHPGKSRGIQILKSLESIIANKPTPHHQIPIVGKIAAGEPMFAFQESEDHLTIPIGFLGSGEYFALHVSGDSMKGIGIHTGDIAIIRQQDMVDNGQIAAVILENEATLKRFFNFSDRVELQSENPDFPNIVLPASKNLQLRIVGKLAGLLTRKMES